MTLNSPGVSRKSGGGTTFFIGYRKYFPDSTPEFPERDQARIVSSTHIPIVKRIIRVISPRISYLPGKCGCSAIVSQYAALHHDYQSSIAQLRHAHHTQVEREATIRWLDYVPQMPMVIANTAAGQNPNADFFLSVEEQGDAAAPQRRKLVVAAASLKNPRDHGGLLRFHIE